VCVCVCVYMRASKGWAGWEEQYHRKDKGNQRRIIAESEKVMSVSYTDWSSKSSTSHE